MHKVRLATTLEFLDADAYRGRCEHIDRSDGAAFGVAHDDVSGIRIERCVIDVGNVNDELVEMLLTVLPDVVVHDEVRKRAPHEHARAMGAAYGVVAAVAIRVARVADDTHGVVVRTERDDVARHAGTRLGRILTKAVYKHRVVRE